MNVLVTYRSRTGNTEAAAEYIGGEFASRGHDVLVRPFDGVSHIEVAAADIVCVGTWVAGIVITGHHPGDRAKLMEIPMLWDKPVAAFMTYAFHAGDGIDVFADWLEERLGANVIAGQAMKAKHIEALAEGFVDDVLARVKISA